ncbi:hypothetical protein IQ268_19230 [Oculatella sp. LEGE 06141]|nr:hypothetical protein [Oculatella sp. LEGE 06141]
MSVLSDSASTDYGKSILARVAVRDRHPIGKPWGNYGGNPTDCPIHPQRTSVILHSYPVGKISSMNPFNAMGHGNDDLPTSACSDRPLLSP